MDEQETAKGHRSGAKKRTEAERVEKHRAVVRRGYYQKKAVKAQLRQELGELEAKHRAVLAAPSPQPEWGCAHADCLRYLFREQVVAKEALRQENDALERRLWRHTDFLDKLQWFLTRQAADASEAPPRPVADPDDANPPGAAVFEPLTPSECADLVRAAQRDICSQRTCPGFRDVGPPVMGWNRKHKFGTTAQFSLLKQFETRAASALASRAWELYATTELLGQLYSGATNMRFDVLQRVDERHLLLRRTLFTDELARPKTTYFLMARAERESQQQIVFRSVDAARIPTEAADNDGWLDMFYWLCFDDQPGGACEVEFGGHVPCISVADTQFWTMEFLSYILRLENRAVDSVFNIDL